MSSALVPRSPLGGLFSALEQDMRRVWDFPTTLYPAADVVETEDTVTVKMDVPGIKKENLDISFEDGVLKVSGQRIVEAEKNADGLYRMERQYGQFTRSIHLPPVFVKHDDIEATLDEGVLTIVFPKGDAPHSRKIELK
jgi:HSP20 family protein